MLSIAAISPTHAQVVCTTGSNGVATCTNPYTPVQAGSCTTTVTVGGTVVLVSGSIPVSTITYSGPPISLYASTVSNGGVVYPSGMCFTGFLPPSSQAPQSVGSSTNMTSIAVLLVVVVLSIGYVTVKRRN